MREFLSNMDWGLFLSWKLLLFPLIIAVIAFVEKRFGTVLGGALSGLPLVSGTVLCFTIFNKTFEEYSQSIYGALQGVIALSFMVYAYSRMTFKASMGTDMQLNAKKRNIIAFKAVGIYAFISYLLYLFQNKLNAFISSKLSFAIGFIIACLVLNFILYKALPKIKPDEHTVNFKFKNLITVALIGTLTFSLFSSLKHYGSSSALLGMLSTAPVYLLIMVYMTHKLSTDYDTLHLNQGIFIGFFGYIIFFSVFMLGLNFFQFNKTGVVVGAIFITLAISIIYAWIFKRINRQEIEALSQESAEPVIPEEMTIEDFKLN